MTTLTSTLAFLALAQPPGTAVPRGAGPAVPDSAVAAAAAQDALAGRRHRRSDFRVLRLTRDSAGAVLTLAFMCPPPHACVGGGGRVRVRRSGRAVVLERFR